MAANPDGADEGTRWGVVAVVLAAGVVGAFQLGKLPAALPALRAELGLGLVAAGWVISAITAVGVVTGMMSGVVSDRLGYRRVLLGGLALIALGSFAGAWSHDTASILITRIIEGTGYIAVITAAPPLLVAVTAPGDRSVAMGVWSFYLPFGMSGMVLISPLVIGLASWRGLWIFNAALALAAICAVAALVRARTPSVTAISEPERVSPWRGMWLTVSRPGPPVLAVAFAAYSLIHLSVIAFLPTFLIERRGVMPDEAALLTAFAMFMNAPGCLVGGWLLKRGQAAWMLVLAGYLGMMGAAFGVFSEDLPGGLRYALAVFLTFSGGLIPPAILARAPFHAASPALVATTIGLIIQLISFGQLIGPPILAALVSRAGDWQDATALTVSAAAVGIAAALALRRLERRL